MIETKEALLESVLETAITRARIKNGVQLVSFTKNILETSPLIFFEAGKTFKNRTFWTSTSEDFYLVGIGSVYQIKANKNRFQKTEDQWYGLLADAIIHNPYQMPGTGLLALGGMAFDPRKNKTELWKNFNHSTFTIPEYMLTKDGNSHYLTVNKHVGQDDDPEQLADEIKKTEIKLLYSGKSLPNGIGIRAKREIAPDQWKDIVQCATDDIKKNKAEKIVLAREIRLKLTKEAEIAAILEKLIATQTNSYVFALEHGKDCFAGATPERLVKLENQHLLSTCLAGTAPKGKTKKDDERLRHELLHDEKNRKEHYFVVKMIKDAIQSYCTDIEIPDQPVVYSLKNLHHLYTPVTARLREGYSIFDIIAQLHPTPALGGVPREKSLQFIRDHELLDRGWYGAPVGWLDSNRNGEFAVAIRSGLFQGDEASLFAGCGVVKDSDPEMEYEETNIKFLPMLSVLEGQQ